ncbi:DUF6233 domain-containing protein [Streptomyces sp. NPDC046860]|uniref:DUF6233 domain-containing protein n=1 Tax=Streptomyces sp. NPDC046860 TaxID=3154495 RepID=UPI0034110319
MAELPDDAPRLRVLCDYLDRQIAETDTVATYLGLLRAEVRQALARAERQAPRQRSMRRAKGADGPLPSAGFARPARAGDYEVQMMRAPDDPGDIVVHVAGCDQITGTPRKMRADEARAALTEGITPCSTCCPETELGIDVA